MALRTIMAFGTLALLLAGCGALADTGPRTTQERDVEDFTAVALETSGDVVVELGDTPSLTITAGERVLDRLTSDVRDGVLVLGSDRPGWGSDGRVDYHVVVTDLEAVHVRGSGDVEVADVDVDALQVRIEGSGDVELAGRAARQAVSVAGSGNYRGASLTSEDATVSIEGSGDVVVDVTRELSATVAGSGVVTHTGGADVEMDVQGSGGVQEG